MRPIRAPTPLSADQAWDYALELLSHRAATAAEVAQRLRRRGVDDARADAIVARLVELHLLDDRAFAAAYLRRRREERGRHALRAELLRKGVAEVVVERALRGDEDDIALDEDQQNAAAAALLAKHAWRFAPRRAAPTEGATAEQTARSEADAARRARARAAAFLARRGFSPDVVTAAVDTLDHLDADHAHGADELDHLDAGPADAAGRHEDDPDVGGAGPPRGRRFA